LGSVELGVQLQAAQFQAPFAVMDQANATALRARISETKAEFFTPVEINGSLNVSGTDFATALAGKQDVLEQPGFGATLLYGNRVKRVGFGAGITGGTDEQPDGSQTLSLAVSSSLTLNNLTLNGSLTGWTPYYCAGRVNGVNVTVGSSIGRVGYTVARASGQATGVFVITFASPAPNNNYVITMLPMTFGTCYLWDVNPPTVNGFHCVVVNNTWQLRNATFHFSVTL
jgi:hypothetical protein